MPNSRGGQPPLLFLGVDPGKSGGVAMIDPLGCVTVSGWPGGSTGTVIQTIFRFGPTPFSEVFCVCERVGGFVKGSGGNIGSSMFEFGRGFGHVEAGLWVAGFTEPNNLRFLPPVTWQRLLDIVPRRRSGSGAESQAEFKLRLAARARGMYPGAKFPTRLADAVLLAEVARRIKGGLVSQQ